MENSGPVDDIEERHQEIVQYIIQNRLKKAALRLPDFARDFANDTKVVVESIVCASEHERILELEHTRQYTLEQSNVARRDLIRSILYLLEEIRDDYRKSIISRASNSIPLYNPLPSFPDPRVH